jgi:hypothetical protein
VAKLRCERSTRNVFGAFINDTFEHIAGEAEKLTAYSKRYTLSVRCERLRTLSLKETRLSPSFFFC